MAVMSLNFTRSVVRPVLSHRVVSLDKKLYATLSLSTLVKLIGTSNKMLRVTLQWTGIPSGGGVSILVVASSYGNWVKLWLSGRPVTCVLPYLFYKDD